MRPKEIILIRHGESEGNVNAKIYEYTPDHELKLTQNGKKQVIEVGKELKNIIGNQRIQFYTSPMLRAHETTEILINEINPPGYELTEEPRIREQDWGNFQNVEETKQFKQERKIYGSFYYRFANGESGADVFDRVSSFFETLHRHFQDPDFPPILIIITHGVTLRCFLMRWYHWSVKKFEKLKNPDNCDYVIMELNNEGKYTLKKGLQEVD